MGTAVGSGPMSGTRIPATSMVPLPNIEEISFCSAMPDPQYINIPPKRISRKISNFFREFITFPFLFPASSPQFWALKDGIDLSLGYTNYGPIHACIPALWVIGIYDRSYTPFSLIILIESHHVGGNGIDIFFW
jgi:hypothetical protein